MDIRVGASAGIGPTGRSSSEATQPIEARLLAVRPARRRAEPVARDKRSRDQASAKSDPAGGRVLVLLVPEGYKLPAGLEQGDYRIFLRLARR